MPKYLGHIRSQVRNSYIKNKKTILKGNYNGHY